MLMRLKREYGKINSSSAMAALAQALLNVESEIDQEKEHFWVIGLDTKLFIKFVDLVTLGTLDASLVHPREVFRLSVMKNVSAITVMHNHPSGDPTPSREDIHVTDSLKKAGEVLGITVHDHIIVGNGTGRFTSMAHEWAEQKFATQTVQERGERFITPELF